MKLLIDLGGETSWLNKSRVLGVNLKLILEALTTVNQVFLKRYKVPPLYQSGVRYRGEPEGTLVFRPEHPDKVVDQVFAMRMSGRAEDFATIPAILKRGWGDCDDLAPWLCAERRQQGRRSKVAVKWKRHRGVKLFHIIVMTVGRDPDDPKKLKWIEEDPSKELGMLEPKWKNPRLYM